MHGHWCSYSGIPETLVVLCGRRARKEVLPTQFQRIFCFRNFANSYTIKHGPREKHAYMQLARSCTRAAGGRTVHAGQPMYQSRRLQQQLRRLLLFAFDMKSKSFSSPNSTLRLLEQPSRDPFRQVHVYSGLPGFLPCMHQCIVCKVCWKFFAPAFQESTAFCPWSSCPFYYAGMNPTAQPSRANENLFLHGISGSELRLRQRDPEVRKSTAKTKSPERPGDWGEKMASSCSNGH
jgi:hypothetical protein